MFSDKRASARSAAQRDRGVQSTTDVRRWHWLLDGVIISAMGFLLYWGAWGMQFLHWDGWPRGTEPGTYRCYAMAFWQGVGQMGAFFNGQCSYLVGNPAHVPINTTHLPWLQWLLAQQSPLLPLHALPREYPLLTILPFTLVMLVPSSWMLPTFGMVMTLIAGSIYCMLRRTRSMGAALAFVAYLLIGCAATALARFDLIPAGLTLAAALLAQRDRWKSAFVLLALAILFKFYPLVLLPVFFIAQQRRYYGSVWYAWRRWNGIVLCTCLCALVMTVSLALSVDGTLSAFAYFEDRPIQIESLAAGLLWLSHFAGYPLHNIVSFGSHNVLSPLSAPLSLLLTLSDIVGLLSLYWLQWRGKLDIFTACLLALLITLLTGKVFSPQYMLWVVPFVAYVGANRGKWLISWGLVGLLTTMIYPFLYALSYSRSYATPLTHIVAFYPFVLLRGLIILSSVCLLFYQAVRTSAPGHTLHEEYAL